MKNYKNLFRNVIIALFCTFFILCNESPVSFENSSTAIAATSKSKTVKSKATKAATVKQAQVYKSPDGKWKPKMFYFDGIVNGKRGQWPITSQDNRNGLHSYGSSSIIIEYAPWIYNPLDFSHKSVFFQLDIVPSVKTGITYTKNDVGWLKDNKILAISTKITDSNNSSYDTTFSTLNDNDLFSDTVLRIDKLDWKSGLIIGYIKYKLNDKYGKKINVEGYFAENFLNDKGRPTTKEIYNKLHPSTNTAKANSSNKKSKNTKTKTKTNAKTNTNKNGNKTILKLPYNAVCPVCGGSGKIICPVCHGQGYSIDGERIVPCMYCGGAGATLCWRCGGTGSIIVYP